jgi:hypothetical protein
MLHPPEAGGLFRLLLLTLTPVGGIKLSEAIEAFCRVTAENCKWLNNKFPAAPVEGLALEDCLRGKGLPDWYPVPSLKLTVFNRISTFKVAETITNLLYCVY